MPESSKRSSKKKKDKDYTDRPYKSHRKKKRLDKREKRKSSRSDKKSFRHNSDACYKCGRVGHYARDCKVKDKIKSLNLDDNIKDSLCKILLNSSPEGSGPDDSGGEESYTSEDLRVLHDESYISSSDRECTPCKKGETCEDEQNTDEFYKLYSQFKDLNINVISSDDWIEMIKLIDDPIIRSQIIDKMGSTLTNKEESPRKEVQTENTTYTMAELKRQLHKRSQRNNIPTTIQDLSEKVNNLKKEINDLKNENIILDKRITFVENINSTQKDKQDADDSFNSLNNLTPEDFTEENKKSFLKTIELITAHKPLAKISITLQNPKLQDKIEYLKNQFSLQICGDHPNVFWERKKYIVSLPYEEDFSEDYIPTKARPCQMNSDYLEL
uniref:CCHC-type domain-containing protein n=1 Tax=Solanum lycopersicum TaxID=4081 RepID=A0A3Q7GK02_SOLLC